MLSGVNVILYAVLNPNISIGCVLLFVLCWVIHLKKTKKKHLWSSGISAAHNFSCQLSSESITLPSPSAMIPGFGSIHHQLGHLMFGCCVFIVFCLFLLMYSMYRIPFICCQSFCITVSTLSLPLTLEAVLVWSRTSSVLPMESWLFHYVVWLHLDCFV